MQLLAQNKGVSKFLAHPNLFKLASRQTIVNLPTLMHENKGGWIQKACFSQPWNSRISSHGKGACEERLQMKCEAIFQANLD